MAVYTNTLDASRISEVMKKTLEKAPICFCCWWIHEDLRMNQKLTGWPNDALGVGTYPPEGKIKHLQLEGIL